MIETLEAIAKEMKKNALKSKVDFANESVPSYAEVTRQVAVGDSLCKIMFTCDLLSPNRRIWHLSFSTIPFAPVPDETAEIIRKAFFNGEESMEMPSIIHGPKVRQYVAAVPDGA